MTTQRCDHLNEFLEMELEILRCHFDKHKYFKGIADKDEAMNNFLDTYAGILRHVFCAYICKHKDCSVWQNLI